MTHFSWLHLTDLHQGMKKQNWLWPGVKEEFFEDLKRLHDRSGPWDLVLFTGDLTQRGSAAEFRKADEILDLLWSHLKALGSTPQLLAVPGNHDLARPDSGKPEVLLLQQWADQPEVQAKFWEKPTSSYRRAIARAFKNYAAWWENQALRPTGIREGLLPGDFSVTVEKDGAKLGVVGLNTAFLQLADGEYEGRLALHAGQFHEACGGDGPEWARQHHACLLLTHHPPQWLDGDSRKHLDAEITDHGRFAVHLCGHLHEVVYRSISEGGTEARRTWQSRSLFGLEFYGGEKRLERLHGYSAGRIEMAGEKGALSFWPREARLVGGVQRNIVQDLSVVLTDDQHTEPVVFDLLRGYDRPAPSSTGAGAASASAAPTSPTALRLKTLIEAGIVAELAKCANRGPDAYLLLAVIDFPREHRPSFDRFGTPMDFWMEVCAQIDQGRVPDGFEELMRAAANQYPGNGVFKQFIATHLS